LEKCVKEYGFVAINLNPDPSGGHWTSAPLTDRHWYPIVFFDTCVYHQPGIDLLTKVIPVDNVLFASEMIGAVRGVEPETGFNYDGTRRYIEGTQNLSPDDRYKIYEGNARRVYPRLYATLKAAGR
jgi:4-oxalmesaconate hydratase